MDSLTHIALGAALGTAVLGRRVGPRAAIWGALCSTLPDFDVLVPWGDPVRAFTLHRAWSHSLFLLTLAAPAVAWLIARLERRRGVQVRGWLALAWLAMISHPLLEAFTVYGPKLLLPFSDRPVGIGSLFIVDPLYTLPLIVGTAVALWPGTREPVRARRWNWAGLTASTLYLGWTVVAQAHVEAIADRSLAASGAAGGKVLVTAAPFTSLLWRVVAIDRDGYREGYYSLLDATPSIDFEHHPSSGELLASLQQDRNVQRLEWFTRGFYAASEAAPGQRVVKGSVSSIRQLMGIVDTASAGTPTEGHGPAIVMTDLRMGQTPWFVYSFIVAERDGELSRPVPVRQLRMARIPADGVLRIWRRTAGDVRALD